MPQPAVAHKREKGRGDGAVGGAEDEGGEGGKSAGVVFKDVVVEELAGEEKEADEREVEGG